MTWTDALVGLAIVVGLAGIIVPVLPGSVLIAGALLVWAFVVGSSTGWVVTAVALLLLLAGNVIKFLWPGKRLKATVPNNTLLVGAIFAVVGFFVIPVVGMLVGFPIGVYVAERSRLGPQGAWPSTKAALKAVAASILIELVFALGATVVWIAGVAAV